MAMLNPYLYFKDNCEEAFNFYKSVFGGEFAYVGRYKDMPPSPEFPIAKEVENMIMHICLPIANGSVLFGADICKGFGPPVVAGNNFSICINANSEAEATKLFNGVSAEGQVTMPLAKQFWGGLFGKCFDKFGIEWIVSFDENEAK